jgi:hypothetical protein
MAPRPRARMGRKERIAMFDQQVPHRWTLLQALKKEKTMYPWTDEWMKQIHETTERILAKEKKRREKERQRSKRRRRMKKESAEKAEGQAG